MEKLWEKLKLIPVLNVINFAYSYALHFYCILYLRITSWVAANQLRRVKLMVNKNENTSNRLNLSGRNKLGVSKVYKMRMNNSKTPK